MKKALLFLGCLGIASITVAGMKLIAGRPVSARYTTTDSGAPTLSHPLITQDRPNVYIREIASDLVTNKLIDRVDRLAFTLDSSELIINGVRQEADIYLKFRSKYVKHAKDHFIYSQYYTSRGSGAHTEVTIDHFGPPL